MNTTYVEFPYLYRDAGNYKREGTRYFPAGGLSQQELKSDHQRLAAAAFDGDAFVPGPVGVPAVYLFDDGEHGDGGYTPSEDDHSLHEFDVDEIRIVSADEVGEADTDSRHWRAFVDEFETIAYQTGGWAVHMFDPAPTDEDETPSP